MAIIVIALATWRLAHILNEEKIAEGLRKKLGEKEVEGLYEYPDTFFANLISCFRCLSVWAAAAAVLLYLVYPPITWIFAASTLAIFFNDYILVE